MLWLSLSLPDSLALKVVMGVGGGGDWGCLALLLVVAVCCFLAKFNSAQWDDFGIFCLITVIRQEI